MDINLVLQHGLLYGVGLSVFLGVLIMASLRWNPEIWLHDAPADVQAAYGPARRPETQRQKRWLSVVFFGGLVALLVYSLAHLAQRLGGELSFGAAFVHLFAVLMTFNVVDLLIIDWLILLVWRPSFAMLPGVDPNLQGMNDFGFHFRAFLKGTAGILVASVVLAALVAGLFALLG